MAPFPSGMHIVRVWTYLPFALCVAAASPKDAGGSQCAARFTDPDGCVQVGCGCAGADSSEQAALAATDAGDGGSDRIGAASLVGPLGVCAPSPFLSLFLSLSFSFSLSFSVPQSALRKQFVLPDGVGLHVCWFEATTATMSSTTPTATMSSTTQLTMMGGSRAVRRC